MIRRFIVAVLLLTPALFAAQDFEGIVHPFLPQAGPTANPREEQLYKQAQEALDQSRWQNAAKAFEEVAALKARRADAALYWQAYALHKEGQNSSAMRALAELKAQYPRSSWVREAGALELEIRQASGQPVNPATEADEELKIYAINSLMHTDSERAVPLLQGILNSNNTVRVKEKALFVAAQSDSPKAQEIVSGVARGSSGPELQVRAIRYLGTNDPGKYGAVLADVYKSANDPKIKRAVLQAYMTSNNKAGVMAAVRDERDPEVRNYALRQLGPMGATKELQQLYQTSTSVADKETIVQALGVAGDAAAIAQIARSATDPHVKIRAMRALGITGKSEARTTLIEIYNSDSNREVRRAAAQGLFVSGDAADLVALARKETDMEMKKYLVQQLSVMDNKQARDYMLEILNK